MEKDINDFIIIVRQKNGIIKIKHNKSNESNIYKLLRDFGFRKSKLDNKIIYFHRQSNIVIHVSLRDIKQAFWEFLKQGNFSNMPSDIELSDILEWYLQYKPIKESELFDYYLSDTLTETETHSLRLLTDPIYKHRYEIQQLLSKFNEWAFHKTTDKVAAFCKNNSLYYKMISDKKFLVFNHLNCESKDKGGFDSWIASYTNERHVGNKKPENVETLKLSFHLDRDFHLIQEYVS